MEVGKAVSGMAKRKKRRGIAPLRQYLRELLFE
jgi:hypothetical protein